ncbi:MAG: YceH family protein [bacterium]
MDFVLDEYEVRVLGSLMEKELITPEYYPLTLNALVNACNQKSNREPVVRYDEKTVYQTLDSLREKRLVYQDLSSGRAPKYGQNLSHLMSIIKKETAVLCVLMLRGPQTAGEIRGRTNRMYDFQGMDELQETIDNLSEMKLVTKLPRQPGRKEHRYVHLLSGEQEAEPAVEQTARPEKAALEVEAETRRISELEQEVQKLRTELSELREEFTSFKKQFE